MGLFLFKLNFFFFLNRHDVSPPAVYFFLQVLTISVRLCGAIQSYLLGQRSFNKGFLYPKCRLVI